jgi:hypothetical protein
VIIEENLLDGKSPKRLFNLKANANVTTGIYLYGPIYTIAAFDELSSLEVTIRACAGYK